MRCEGNNYIRKDDGMRKDYEEIIEEKEVPVPKTQLVKVTTNLLNIRKGPGMNYPIAGNPLKLNEEVEITEVVNDFGHLKKSGNWINMAFVKKI